jgi:sec-independent protein translocase protein TatC
LQLRLSFAIGLIPATPLVILQLWGFVAPGLKERERRPFRVLAPFSILLFLLGAGFCWLILPAALQWFGSYLANYKDTSLIQSPSTMIFFIAKMMLAFGIGFELPLVVYALGALGLLSSETLIKYWRQATVFIFIAAATLTPSNDAFSMLMMAIPLCILFLISVYAVKFTQRKRKKQEEDVYAASDDDYLD